MKDYKNAVLAGIEAAKQAADNKSEIQSVISELNSQIKEVSENKATLGIRSLYRQTESSALNAFLSISQRLVPQKSDKYFAICISDNDGNGGIEVAEWLQEDSGYPCTIKYSGQKFFCSDKKDLEESLAKLLQEVKVGEAIIQQMKNFDRKTKSDPEGKS